MLTIRSLALAGASLLFAGGTRGVLANPSRSHAASCESLAEIRLPHATIQSAAVVAPGTFSPAGGTGTPAYRALPAFCRVMVRLAPTADSDIEVEVWAPVENWNGKFEAVGNGAFSGSIPYAGLASALSHGYAVGATNTGHNGGSARFALESNERVIDFGWRAVHEMVGASKAIVTAFYGRDAAHAYWDGCSAGGREALMEAQRFPEDFDGIVAGSPGLDWTGRASQAVRVAHALDDHPEAQLSQAARALLHGAVVKACDALDGVTDGLIENPRRCEYDPTALRCMGAAGNDCLTPAQLATVRLIYSSVNNKTTGRAILGLSPGSELGWTDLGWTGSARATGLDQFRYIVFRDSTWTIARFDADVDAARAESADNSTINAMDPDLRAFFARGGKLIQYHGWSDPQISPGSSVQYHDAVRARVGAKIDDSYRLFMAPGMAHCGGGEGPNVFDALAALERWVERSQAPDEIIASHRRGGAVDRTRPLCPWPGQAVYKGTGSIDAAESFACRER